MFDGCGSGQEQWSFSMFDGSAGLVKNSEMQHHCKSFCPQGPSCLNIVILGCVPVTDPVKRQLRS